MKPLKQTGDDRRDKDDFWICNDEGEHYRVYGTLTNVTLPAVVGARVNKYADEEAYCDVLVNIHSREPAYHPGRVNSYPNTGHEWFRKWCQEHANDTFYIHLMQWSHDLASTRPNELRITFYPTCDSDGGNTYITTLGSCLGSEVQSFVDSFIPLL